MWDEGSVRAAARARHGVVDRQALLALGVSDAEIIWRLSSGRLEEHHPGVYYLDATPATWTTELLAGVLAAGPHAAASHRAAGVLWSLDGVYGRLVEVTVPFTKEPAPKGAVLHRTRRPLHRITHLGVPVTTVERTILDLAALLPPPVLEKAISSAIRRNLTTIDSLARTISSAGGRGVKGTRSLRRTLVIVEGDRSGSPVEVDVAQLIRGAPIPDPVQQLRIRLPSGSNAYPDFAWPDQMKIVETDGFEAHSTPEQLSHDLERQNALMSIGWSIRRFSARDIRRDPHRVISEIVEFIAPPPSVRVSRD